MPRQITKSYGGFLFVDPSASREEVAAAILPSGQEFFESGFPCRITTERRRVVDRVTGRRATRDWRIGHFLMWRDGEGAADMGREETQSVLAAAREAAWARVVQAHVIFGRVTCLAVRVGRSSVRRGHYRFTWQIDCKRATVEQVASLDQAPREASFDCAHRLGSATRTSSFQL